MLAARFSRREWLDDCVLYQRMLFQSDQTCLIRDQSVQALSDSLNVDTAEGALEMLHTIQNITFFQRLKLSL